jgi:hypothetical protein
VSKLAKNPFKFGDPVDGAYYFQRTALASAVRQFLESGVHVVLIGPRRFGKTSFMLDMLRREEKNAFTCLFVDVFNVTSHRDFLQQLLRALRMKEGWTQKVKDVLHSVRRLRPRLGIDADPNTGQPAFSIAPALANEDIKETIQDTLLAVGKIGERVIVAFDEVQAIAELEDSGWLEATLRTQMQQLKNTSFLFSGSRKSIINDMLNNPARPFYRSCQPIEFPALGAGFSAWIVERFKTVGVQCSVTVADELRRLVQDTPNYVQMACFHLVAQGVAAVNERAIREVLRTIVKQNAYAYQTLMNTLTASQQRALRLCAIEQENVYSRELLGKYEIPSGPALAASIKALKQKQILDEGTARGKVMFDDPLFSIWLAMEFGGELTSR